MLLHLLNVPKFQCKTKLEVYFIQQSCFIMVQQWFVELAEYCWIEKIQKTSVSQWTTEQNFKKQQESSESTEDRQKKLQKCL